jgi:hypothetical protein
MSRILEESRVTDSGSFGVKNDWRDSGLGVSVDAFELVRKRAAAAGIKTRIGNHLFRATSITVFRETWRIAQKCGVDGEPRQHAHDQLYDRRSDDVTLDEVERIIF